MATITIKEKIIKVMRILRSRFIPANQSLHKQRNLLRSGQNLKKPLKADPQVPKEHTISNPINVLVELVTNNFEISEPFHKRFQKHGAWLRSQSTKQSTLPNTKKW